MSLERLRKIAGDATPGPWKVWMMSVMADPVGNGNLDDGIDVADTYWPGEQQRTFNATYISTFDPPMVKALLDVAEAADRALTDRSDDPAIGVALADDLSDALDRLREVSQ